MSERGGGGLSIRRILGVWVGEVLSGGLQDRLGRERMIDLLQSVVLGSVWYQRAGPEFVV